MKYEDYIGCKVVKKLLKPFKSTNRGNTVKGIIDHPKQKDKKVFIFKE